MTNRVRHYHLGCGESLCTHYSLLFSEKRDSSKSITKKTGQPANYLIRQKRSKG